MEWNEMFSMLRGSDRITHSSEATTCRNEEILAAIPAELLVRFGLERGGSRVHPRLQAPEGSPRVQHP